MLKVQTHSFSSDKTMVNGIMQLVSLFSFYTHKGLCMGEGEMALLVYR